MWWCRVQQARANEREEREEERKTLRKAFIPGICFTVVLSESELSLYLSNISNTLDIL